MFSHRRNQSDALFAIVSQSIKRISKRKLKLIARARDVENLNEVNSELNIELNVDEKRKKKISIVIRKSFTKKDLLSNTRIRSTIDVVVDANFHDNNVESRRAIETHTTRQSREIVVVDRLRRKQIAKEIVWKKECKVYDEKKIWNRYYDELATSKDANILFIFEIEKLIIENEKSNSQITIFEKYRVNKKHTWSNNFSQCHCNEFKILNFKNQLDDVIKARARSQQEWFIINILTIVKIKDKEVT